MAQYDLLLTQNVSVAGTEFSEKYVNIGKGDLLSGIATTKVPTVLAAGTNGYMLVRDDAEATGLKWIAIQAGHTQGTDAGTTGTVFELDTDGYKIELTAESASKMGVKVDGGATYADFQAKDITCNDLTVNGTTTTINSTTLQVDDKNIELGTVAVPSDTTADGGGITLKGATDKTIIWDNANDNWTLNQNVNIPTSTTYKINNSTVLSATQVLGVTLGTMAAATATDYMAKSLLTEQGDIIYASAASTPAALAHGNAGQVLQSGGNAANPSWLTLGTMAAATATDYVTKALYDAYSILYADSDNTPAALTVAASTFVGRKASGGVTAMTVAEAMALLWVSAPATKTSSGTAGTMAKDANYWYVCDSTDVWSRIAKATNW